VGDWPVVGQRAAPGIAPGGWRAHGRVALLRVELMVSMGQCAQRVAAASSGPLKSLAPQLTRPNDALTALAAAAITLQAPVAPHVPPWMLFGQITHGKTAPTTRSR
jgi:hypothetical protein